jgi:chromosome segregation ATPase
MNITYLFAGLIICLILTGCGQSKLVTENQQLKQQLDSITQKADKTESDLKAALLKIDSQNQQLEALTNRISDYQKSADKMQKDLEMYRGKAKEAIEDIKALDGILDEDNLDTATYAQHYIDTKIEVTKLVSPMSESEVGKRILSLIGDCDDIKNTLENTDSQLKQTEVSENEAFRNDAALANGKYEVEDIRFEHTTNLLEKIKDIKINQAGMILKIRTKLALDILNVETLMKTETNPKI